MAATPDPERARALEDELATAYAGWREAITALTRRGEFEAPEVKAFTVAVQQASLLHASLKPDELLQRGAAYRAVAEQRAADLFSTPLDTLVQQNPLLLVPALPRVVSAEAAAARGVPLVEIEHDGRTAEVRSDVVMVFAPGVARTGEEFIGHQRAAVEAGLASVVADTQTPGPFTIPR